MDALDSVSWLCGPPRLQNHLFDGSDREYINDAAQFIVIVTSHIECVVEEDYSWSRKMFVETVDFWKPDAIIPVGSLVHARTEQPPAASSGVCLIPGGWIVSDQVRCHD
jgi:hypothetical protein